jgi:pimeloyl-[acyl-carrier protein] methyl ester esterase
MGTFVTPSGQRLHVEDTGRGPPILLLHGWAASSAILGPFAAALGAGRRVVRYDLRGHGDSAPALTAGLDDHAGDLGALVDGLALDGALLVGWSLGAQVILRALPAIARRIRAVALIGATPRFTARDGWADGLPARQVELLAQRFSRDPARTRARFLADLLTLAEREQLGPARLAAIDAGMRLPDSAAALAGLELLATADLRGELGAIGLPVLLVHGDADPICLPGAARAMAEAIPGARLVLLAGAGHAPFLTREAEVAAALLSFAESLP